jgi:signal transduction histidine kinase
VVDVHIGEVEEPKSEDVSLCLYRVAQESLNNALKHARTSVVALTVTKLRNTFYMTIQDSGVGFDCRTKHEGLGLVSMRERLRLVDGEFRLHSFPGRGTEIWVEAPDRQKSIDSDPFLQSSLQLYYTTPKSPILG